MPELPHMQQICRECGAEVPADATCQANFHRLLALEWDIPGGPGERAHFLAVATYGIQHPASMGYTGETVEGLRQAVRDVVEGDATIAEIRLRTRSAADAAGRVTRRAGEPIPHWPIEEWGMNVTGAVVGGVEGYQERVAQWARSVVTTLAGVQPVPAEDSER